jgi:SAM-dependent methyltransferase
MNYWDRYFLHHRTYKPAKRAWELADVEKLSHWYANWFFYIERTARNIDVRGKHVLEIGCGIGGVCKILYEKGASVTGSDVSSKALAAAARLQPDVKFRFLNIENKQHSFNTFDYVFAFEVLEHISSPEKAIQNIRLLLKSHGIFIGSTPYPFPKNLLDPTHKNVLYPDEWKTLFRRSGFRKIIIKPLSFPPLLWRLHPSLNIPLPWYIRHTKFVSTSLIIAYV